MVSGHVQHERAYDDVLLVQQVRAGDARAFDGLFRRYYNRIYGFAYQLTGDPAAAEDVAQEAFVRAYTGITSLRDGAAFLEWMYRITLNLARDRARQRKRKPWLSFFDLRKPDCGDETEPVEFADASLDPARVAESEGRDRALHAAIAALPLEFREVVVLHHLQKLDIQQIARLLRVPEGTVKSRLGRARAKLRSALADWVDGGNENGR